MFGNDSLPSVIYSYDAMPPSTHGDEIRSQLRSAHDYRNKLVAIERSRRERVNAVLFSHYPRLVELETTIESLAGEIAELRDDAKRANAMARRRTGTNRDEIRERTARLSAMRAERKALRTQAFGDKKSGSGDREFLAAMARVDADAELEAKEAYNACGAAWGTRLQIMQAAQSFRKGSPPKFQRYEGDGKQAVQLQGGMSLEELFAGNDSRLRVTVEKVRHAGKKLAVAQLRIGSLGSRKEPLFADVRFHLHRPLPTGASIKWAWLLARRVGTKTKWKLQFAVSRSGGFGKPDLAKEGEIGINLGWRLLPDNQGLRVATWEGSDGDSGELVITPDRLSGWAKCEDLQATRDRFLNGALETLAAWINGLSMPAFLRDRMAYLERKADRRIPEDRRGKLMAERAIAAANRERFAWQSLADAWQQHGPVELPEPIRQRFAGRRAEVIPTSRQCAAYAANWRKAARLASLVIFWKQNRFDGDSQIFDALEAWRRQDEHLFNWQANLRRRVVAWRDDYYRKFVARLRRRYRVVKLGGVDYKQLQRKPDPEDEESGAVGYFRVAACGRLRELLVETFADSVPVPPFHMTTDHDCGQRCVVDGRKSHLHTCERCGVEFDIDRNNARNTLAWQGDASESVA